MPAVQQATWHRRSGQKSHEDFEWLGKAFDKIASGSSSTISATPRSKPGKRESSRARTLPSLDNAE
jgi:hypothetical protein